MPGPPDRLAKALLRAIKHDSNAWAIAKAAAAVVMPEPRSRPFSSEASAEQWNQLRTNLKRHLGGGTRGQATTRSTTHGTLITDRQARLLYEEIVDALGVWRPAEVAHQLLFAIDEVLGESLVNALNSGTEVELKEGDLIPIAVQRLDTFLGDDLHFTARAKSKGLGLEALEHIGILPTLPFGSPYEVVLDYRYPLLCSAFFERPVLAVILPNVGTFDDHFTSQVDLTAKTFFDVRPKSPHAQRKTIEMLLGRAERAGAMLAVLPELSVDDSISEWISKWVARPTRRLKTVLGGSLHRSEGSQRINRATLFGPGAGHGVHHHKFNPYRHPYGDVTLDEDLKPRRMSFRVLFCGSRSVSFAICKDVLAEGAKAVLNALRLNALLVAALSSESSSFLMDGGGRASSGQTLTFVANYPGIRRADVEVDVALAALPVQGHEFAQFPAERLQAPGALMLDLRARPLQWRVC